MIIRFTKVCRECNCSEFEVYDESPGIYNCKECEYPNNIDDLWDVSYEVIED